MDLGPHAAFIIASYAIVAIAMLALVAWLVFDGRRYQRALDALEARGVRRRSHGGDQAR
jgi:heme exporter protein D